MIVDVRDFNLICGFAESSESGFSTTYCGYPKFVEIHRNPSKSIEIRRNLLHFHIPSRLNYVLEDMQAVKNALTNTMSYDKMRGNHSVLSHSKCGIC